MARRPRLLLPAGRSASILTPCLAKDRASSALRHDALARVRWRGAALAETDPVLYRLLEGLFIDRMDGNEEIFDRIMNDAQFRDLASRHLVRDGYGRLRAGKGDKV